MTRNVVSLGGICVALLFLGLSKVSADWVAYNDHAPGAGTSPNATTNNVRLETSGPLKDISTGTNLPVTLSITRSGSGVTFNNSGATPAAGTPLANTFNGFVFFGVAPDSNVEITNSTVTYTFTGLNPAMRYSFKGGANRSLTAASGSNRWTRVEISGATSFIDAHSQRVVTFAQAANDLLANQVAVNFATNTVSGDIVDWEEIDPGADGSFAVICSQYQGFIPNGGRSTGTNGYAITGIRLEEIPNGPPQIGTQPSDLTVTAGNPASFTVSASGRRPLSYQWYRNGSLINGETGSNYVIASASLVDDAAKFSVRVSNSVGSVLSSNGTLHVLSVPIDLISVTNTLWKYNQTGANLGTAWKEVSYDDSGWPSGFGVLAWETDNQTVIPLTNTVISLSNLITGARITTHYFRTHINIDDPTAYSITASNLIDDGAVVYVNGVEVHRENLPLTVIRFDTVASAAIEAAWTGYPIAPSYFVSGDNIVAAEIHNNAATSSDAGFGMRLQARELPTTAIVITNQPTDVTALEGANATLTIGFSGGRVQLQWYKLSGDTPVLIPGATRSPYTISNVLAGDAGFYFVVISNTLGTVSSDLAELSVVADLDPPKVLTAQTLNGNSGITLSFSEPILAETATNVANYVVTNLTSSGIIGVNSVTLANGTNLILTLATPLAVTENYLVLVNNLQDVSPRHNVIAPDLAAPVSRELTLIALNQPGWAFYNPVLGPPYEAFEPPADWNQLNFQVPDNDWGQGAAGLFAYNPGQSQLPAPVLTSISGGAISSYYRFTFPFEGSPVGAQFSLRRIVSDGLAGYLNGSEILRFNLPNGTITPFTPATFDSGLNDSTLTLSGLPIRYGTNVFAVELHAHDMNDNFIAFGSELRARILSLAHGPVIITAGPGDVTVVEGQAAEFKFVAAGASGFTWYTNGFSVAGADLDTLRIDKVPLGLDGLSVSVIATNSSSTAISTNAHLHVLPDLTPPRLLNAAAVSNAVLLTFNEPMDASSLLNPGNYYLVNISGGAIRGTAATLTSPSNVVVTFGSTFPAGARIVVNGVRDASTAQNEIACNTSATIGWDLVIPIDATWRYNTNGTDLGTAWRNVSYPDTTADWPLGAGLIADETAPLPAPIKTPISRLVNGIYHFTFYFRYHFTVPAGIQNVPVTFRHIIDDGALMYINGQQFHSFNMTNDANNVNYNFQAAVNVGDAVYSAPFNTTFSNLFPGDNVIAVEVHQNGTAGSDVTFGAEFSMHVPSVVSDLAVDRLSLCQSGANITLSWGGNRWTLEASDTLGTNAVWTPVAQHSNSFRASATGPQRFYRLRQ